MISYVNECDGWASYPVQVLVYLCKDRKAYYKKRFFCMIG